MKDKHLSLDALKGIAGSAAEPVTTSLPDTAPAKSLAGGGMRQLSVKVAMPNYERLRRAAVATKMSHQVLLSDALAEWLTRNGY